MMFLSSLARSITSSNGTRKSTHECCLYNSLCRYIIVHCVLGISLKRRLLNIEIVVNIARFKPEFQEHSVAVSYYNKWTWR